MVYNVKAARDVVAGAGFAQSLVLVVFTFCISIARAVEPYQSGQLFHDGPSAINKIPVEEPVDPVTATVKEGEMVFLLHGIGKGKYDMAPMARFLRRRGYTVVNWGYPSTKYTLAELASLLAKEVQRFPEYRVHFVTHSMGGIVVRTMLAQEEVPSLGRIVMIAPPSQGAELAQFFGSWSLYKYLLGPAGQELKPGDLGKCVAAGVPRCEFAIIAGGTGRPRGLNPLLPGDNDGTVTVESTMLEGCVDFALVPYPHPVIQMMPKTAELTYQFLEAGRFSTDTAVAEAPPMPGAAQEN